MLWPTLQALLALGGSASVDELDAAVTGRERWSEAQQAVLHRQGPRTMIEYRLAWARTYLKGMGLVTNSQRAVWTVTPEGRAVTEVDVPGLYRAFGAKRRRGATTRTADERRLDGDAGRATPAGDQDQVPVPSEDPGDSTAAGTDQQPGDEPDADAWRDVLLATLLALEPSGFERVAQRLLREAGFLSATVTGRSGDGGIDGVGVYRMSLLSFPVFFQCKRYRGSVGAGAVRDFRGAMAGRGDKGLLITTGTFTTAARAEASRDGAPPVDLIDGDRLCDLLRDHGLGVRTTTRTVEDITVDPSFFASVAGS